MATAINEQSEREKYRICYDYEKYGCTDSVPEYRKQQLEVLESEGTFLDVGCGRGALLKYVSQRFPGLKAEGTVFGEPGCEGFPTHYGYLPSLSGLEKYDFVSCYEVLEHLPVQDVLPSLDRLLALANKALFFSCNDRFARGMQNTEHSALVLHMSRFPLRWWIHQVNRLAAKIDARPSLIQRVPAKKHNWYFTIDKRRRYEPIDQKKVDFTGYGGLDTDFWFWYAPEFPISEIPSKPSRPEVLADPAVKALWADLDARGLKSPILLHNIPGQPHRRYWTRCGNHRRHWAEARGLTTIPAIIYGGCEYTCHEKPFTLEQANSLLTDGKLTTLGFDSPNVIGIRDWSKGIYP